MGQEGHEGSNEAQQKADGRPGDLARLVCDPRENEG